MGKKKRKDLKPWCYYCDREFDDSKILIQHQKAKHFKCGLCNKKMSTAGGLLIHLDNVHKETIRAIPNALDGRESVDVEIFGMEGVPPEELQKHIEKKEREYGRSAVKTAKTSADPVSLLDQFKAFQEQRAHSDPASTFAVLASISASTTAGNINNKSNGMGMGMPTASHAMPSATALNLNNSTPSTATGAAGNDTPHQFPNPAAGGLGGPMGMMGLGMPMGMGMPLMMPSLHGVKLPTPPPGVPLMPNGMPMLPIMMPNGMMFPHIPMNNMGITMPGFKMNEYNNEANTNGKETNSGIEVSRISTRDSVIEKSTETAGIATNDKQGVIAVKRVLNTTTSSSNVTRGLVQEGYDNNSRLETKIGNETFDRVTSIQQGQEPLPLPLAAPLQQPKSTINLSGGLGTSNKDRGKNLLVFEDCGVCIEEMRAAMPRYRQYI